MIVILAFLLALAPLVFIHELGHFLAAKGFGIGVPVFSIGFGPRLLGFRRKETDYRFSAIPLGGYVRMAGDEADENRTGAPDEFLQHPRWQRFVVYVAGATFNIVFAVLAVWLLFWAYGKTEGPPAVYPEVASVVESSSAAAADVRAGDRIVAIAGKDVLDWETFTEAYRSFLLSAEPKTTFTLLRGAERVETTLGAAGSDPGFRLVWKGWTAPVIAVIESGAAAERAGLLVEDQVVGVEGRGLVYEPELRALLGASAEREIKLSVERAGAPLTLSVTPQKVDGKGRIGVGFRQADGLHRDLGPAEAFVESVRLNVNLSTTVLSTVKRMITRQESVKSLSGPIEIAQVAKRALVAGLPAFFSFLALVSLQLGIFNLLPIPVLDGGHILVLGVEGIMRRDFSERVKERVMQVGLVFLLVIFAIVTYNDSVKYVFQFFKRIF